MAGGEVAKARHGGGTSATAHGFCRRWCTTKTGWAGVVRHGEARRGVAEGWDGFGRRHDGEARRSAWGERERGRGGGFK